jgi:hypothetical protein
VVLAQEAVVRLSVWQVLASSVTHVTDQLADMFYIIGLGLCDEKDITFRGLEVGHTLFLTTDVDTFVRP